VTAFDTALRPSEQLALQWDAVDFYHKKILVRHGLVRGEMTDLKTKASAAAIDMLPTVEQALRDQLDGMAAEEGYVFPNEESLPNPAHLCVVNASSGRRPGVDCANDAAHHHENAL
jgi:hypothetical protein